MSNKDTPRLIHQEIALELDEHMHFLLTRPDGQTIVTDAWAEVEADGETLNDFTLESVTHETVETDLGTAQRLVAVGTVELPHGIQLRRTLTVEAYPQWANALILQARYDNLADAPVSLERIAESVLHLDSSRLISDASPNDFWAFRGIAVEWGQDLAFPFPTFLAQDNYLGHRDNGEGGGIPLLYVWNQEMGIALAHLETVPKLWYMPMKGGSRNGVQIALEDREPVDLPPGGSFQTLRTMLSVHKGDFYAPVNLYAQILMAEGLHPAETNAEDYALAWCSWGYEFDVRPEEVLGVIPKLKEMGMQWVTLDDRWFDTYGDWNPRSDTFPGGEEQMRKMVKAIHDAGLYAQIWWYPLAVEDGVGGYDSHQYRVAKIVEEHPDWLCRHPDGTIARNNRGLAILDPAIPGVQEYIVELTRRFIEDWDFDGHKLDNIYNVPPCYHSPYHEDPEVSLAAFAEVYRLIHETTRALKPHSVTQICSCGTPVLFSLIPNYDQAVTADPTSSLQVRRRIKYYKALLGPQAAVFADHVELSDNGEDFASAVGTGGVPGTKFVWPEDEAVRARLEEWWGLSPEKETLWKRWFGLYNELRLSEGEYLNLYDIAYDKPEAHVIRKDDHLYYAFYAPSADDEFSGTIELRGLEPRRYRVRDYVNDRDLGTVEGPNATLEVEFTGALLLDASPE